MKSLRWLLFLLFSPLAFSQTTVNLSSGANNSAWGTAIATAAASGSGGIVQVGAGSYSGINLDIPCPANFLIITGPVTGYPFTSLSARPTAFIHAGTSGHYFRVHGGCSHPVSFLYMDMDGGQPTTGGGAISYDSGAQGGLIVKFNYIHGNGQYTPFVQGTSPNQSVNYDDSTDASLVYVGSGWTQSGPTAANMDIEYNLFGNGINDCQGRQTWSGLTYNCNSSGQNCTFAGYDSIGGMCSALTMGGNNTNLTFSHNFINYQEQGIKGLEGGNGNPQSTLSILTNTIFQYNTILQVHRIAHESQMSPLTPSLPFLWQYNVVNNQLNPAFGSWQLSAPQANYSKEDDNLMIANQSGAGPGAFEYWGNLENNNNTVQGNIGCPVHFGYGTTSSNQVSNNIYQWTGNPGDCNNVTLDGVTHVAIQNEFPCCNPGYIPQNLYPTQNNNLYTGTVSQLISKQPTISPTPGPISAPITVILQVVNNGDSSGRGARNNTGIWYTTDGSNPVPGGGTSKFYVNSFTVNPGTTVKAIGMWGDVTQPLSYSAPYGYIPSSILTANYPTSGVTPTLNSVTLTLQDGTSSVVVPNTTQACANIGYVSPTTSSQICGAGSDGFGTSVQTYTSSDPTKATINGSSGVATAVAAGTTNLSVGVVQGAITKTASPFTLTVTAAPVIFQGCYQGNATDINTVAVGAFVDQYPVCYYNDGSALQCGPTADIHGNVASSYTSSDPTKGTIQNVGAANPGRVTGVATGTFITNVTVNGTVSCSQWNWTTTKSLTSLAIATTGGIVSFPAGTTNQLIPLCRYSDGSSDNCSSFTITWTSSSLPTATVSSSGLINALAAGTSNIGASIGSTTATPIGITVTSAPPSNGSKLTLNNVTLSGKVVIKP